MGFNSFSRSVKLDNIKTYNSVNTTNNLFKKNFYSDTKQIDYNNYEEIDYSKQNLESVEKNKKITIEEATASTILYFTTVGSAHARIYEHIFDFLLWTGTLFVTQFSNRFVRDVDWYQNKFKNRHGYDLNMNTKKITKKTKELEESSMDLIGKDLTTELNGIFYEGTELGNKINEKSFYKYDSEELLKARNITSDVILIIESTAVTVVTGGATIPVFASGFMVGAGQSAEKNFQDKENRNFLKDSVEIGIDGTIKGLSTVAYGKAGATAVNGVKTISNLGLTGTKELVKNGVKEISKEGIKETIKNNGKTILKSTAINTLKDKDTWIETGAVLADDVKIGIQTGEWNITRMLGDAALIYGENYIGNLFGNFTGNVLDNFSNEKSFNNNHVDNVGITLNTTNEFNKVMNSVDDYVFEMDLDSVPFDLREGYEQYFKSLANSIKMDQNVGKSLEDIFDTENYVIGVHKSGISNPNDIVNEGLRLTGDSSSGVAFNGIDLNNNIVFEQPSGAKDVDFLRFCKNIEGSAGYKTVTGEGNAIIIKIPKVDFDNINKLTFLDGDQYVLKNDYIVGYVKTHMDDIGNVIFDNMFYKK